MSVFAGPQALSAQEQAFQRLYQETAERLQFQPQTAEYSEYVALREAMLPGLDAIMEPFPDKWHRMAAYLPDVLEGSGYRDIRYPPIGFARYIPVPAHASESYEIFMMVRGAQRLYINQQPVDLTSGDVLLLAPGVASAGGLFNEESLRRSILLRRRWVAERFSVLMGGEGVLSRFLCHTAEGTGGDSWCLFHMGDAIAGDPWMQMLYGLPAGGAAEDRMRVALEDGLLMSFLANLDLQYSQTAQIKLCEFSSVEDAILDCLQHEFATIDRATLSVRFGYSERQLLRIVRNRTGMSYKEYITHLRLSSVADLLINSRYSIKSIMESAGYENNSAFYELFRNKYHMSPREFRKQHQ